MGGCNSKTNSAAVERAIQNDGYKRLNNGDKLGKRGQHGNTLNRDPHNKQGGNVNNGSISHSPILDETLPETPATTRAPDSPNLNDLHSESGDGEDKENHAAISRKLLYDASDEYDHDNEKNATDHSDHQKMNHDLADIPQFYSSSKPQHEQKTQQPTLDNEEGVEVTLSSTNNSNNYTNNTSTRQSSLTTPTIVTTTSSDEEDQKADCTPAAIFPLKKLTSKKLGGIQEVDNESNADDTTNGDDDRNYQVDDDYSLLRTVPASIPVGSSSSTASNDDRIIAPAGPLLFHELPSESKLFKVAQQFVKQIDFDPWDDSNDTASSTAASANHKLHSDSEVHRFLVDTPDLCRVKFHLQDYFASPLFPLSILCSFKSSTKETIENCFWNYPQAIDECDIWVGTPLHYACSYQADTTILEFLIRMEQSLLSRPNTSGRLPLHMMTVFPTPSSSRSVDLLLQQYPKAASTADKDGYLPLHLACENLADLAIMQHLLAVNPNAITATTKQGSTPLHFACLHGAPIEIIDHLLQSAASALDPSSTNKGFEITNIFDHLAMGAKSTLGYVFSGGITVTGNNDNSGASVSSLKMTATDIMTPASSLCRTMDSMGQLPLHMALLGGASADVVRRLVQLYPESRRERTDRGDTPWQMAHRLHASPEVLQVLLFDRAGPGSTSVSSSRTVTSTGDDLAVAMRRSASSPTPTSLM